MTKAKLEHVNVTVKDPTATAELLVKLFDWRVRWQGEAIHGGFTVHVGADDSYVALYSSGMKNEPLGDSYHQVTGLNHLGIVVDKLDDVEKKVIAAGFKPHSHADYEPGQRFYFEDNDGLEIEVISYPHLPTDEAETSALYLLMF